MIYPDSFSSKLGIERVIKRINDLCASAPGRRAGARYINYSSDYNTVIERIDRVDQMTRLIGAGDPFRLGSLHDLTGELNSLRPPGTFLVPEQLSQLVGTLSAISTLTHWLEDEENRDAYRLIADIITTIDPLTSVSAAINRTIDRYGQVKDNASPELAEIRQQLARTQASVGSIMRRVMTRAVEGGYLEADTSPVVRSGRLVLPVSPMNKRKIPGIVHDESATGKTYYIEPAELVEANNRIRELQLDEKREVTRILRLLADEIRPSIDPLLNSIDRAGLIDAIRAIALYAIETNAKRPHISADPQLEWYHAVNPVLEASLNRNGKKTVPLDITLSPNQRILIISGPNAGGKSVCLKTVGLIQYMMQSGIMPPVYENSHMGLFDNIFIDIGDDQSIEDDLSTYSSHLRNMKFFLSNASKSTLILIDEFGTGTEPQIGGAIAQAILSQLNDRRAWGVITTHYQNLKTFADETDGLVNGSMLYDRQLMQPLFKLSIGNAGSSFAIEIARKIGLPSSIIDHAEQLVGSDYINMDRFLLDIARDKRYWENKRRDIRLKEKHIDDIAAQYSHDADVLKTQRRAIIEQARQEAEKIIAGSNAAVERTIREIREAQADKERTRQARQQLADERRRLQTATGPEAGHALLDSKRIRRRKSQPAPQKSQTTVPDTPLQPGMNVKMEGQSTVGTVISLEDKDAVVSFGALKIKVDRSRLKPTTATPRQQGGVSFVSSQTTDASRTRQLNFKQEIDLRGMRLDEALSQVTYYLDDAIQFNATRVRILHGTGTGALKQGIRQYLATLDEVSDFRDELPQFGGAGVTIVDLK